MIAAQQLYPAFNLPQCKALGALAAKPEVLNGFAGCGKAKKPPTFHPHEHLGTVRVGALGNHDLKTHYVLTSISDLGSPASAAPGNSGSHHCRVL
ncbi:MAG TPA: hypothetical protein VFP71_07375 [Candidatus Angelobacter sp.]|nr:hypothetical protein [Candidatus Angelobacter sp.]